MSICDTFRSRAFWTWDTLGLARHANCQLGEETLTDMNLLELRIRHPLEVLVKTFTKNQEGNNGADWEWWLTGTSGKWLGFRIQAKVLDLQTEKFEHLHYKAKKPVNYQCEILIKSALAGSTKLIPIYCLYINSSTLLLQRNHWPCNSFPPAAESFGCSLLSPFVVRALRTPSIRNSLSDVMPSLLPWHCLVCCTGFGGDDLPSKAWHYWQNAIRMTEDTVLSVKQTDNRTSAPYWRAYKEVALLEEPPLYVKSIASDKPTEPPDGKLRGVMVLKEKNDRG